MKGKKNKFKSYDDDDDLFGDDHELNGGSMAEFENYQKFDVITKTAELSNKAKSIIDGIANAYLSLPDPIDDNQKDAYDKANKLIENIKYIESSNLALMIEQVQIAKHLMHTMIERLDAGGYVNDSLFSMIQEQQKQVMSILLQFSKYARSLPDYFEITRSELKLSSPIQSFDENVMLQSSSSSGLPVTTMQMPEDSQTYSLPPMRGTMDIALSVQQSIKQLSEKFETTEATIMDFDPDQLVDEDDSEEDIDYYTKDEE